MRGGEGGREYMVIILVSWELLVITKCGNALYIIGMSMVP